MSRGRAKVPSPQTFDPKMKNTMGIWANGRDELLETIDQEESKALAPLMAALEKNELETQEIKRRIAEMKAEFKKKRKETRGCLFAR